MPPGRDLSGTAPRFAAKTSEAGSDRCACLPPVRSERVSFDLFTEGDALYDALAASIASARREILLESFIFAADEVGWRLGEALAERARQGVAVRIHLDAAGSAFRMTRALVRHLRDHGVAIRWFHRWSWRQPLLYYRRNHRKLLVDRHEAFLGGFNIHRENSYRHYGEGRWRDTHVRIRGDLVSRAATYFDWLWQERGPSAPGALPEHAAAIPGALLVATPSPACRQRLVCIYQELFDRAERFIYITTPYFGPGRTLHQAACRAARRGLDVRLLVPQRSDPVVAGWVTRGSYASLLEAGVRIFEYLPRRLHAKTFVIDGQWGSVGSVNLDTLSLFVNQELLLLARSRPLAGSLREAFLGDLRDADEIRLEVWRQRGAWQRLLETAGRSLQPLV